MATKTKSIGFLALLGVLVIGMASVVYAQQTLPKGGDSFETAVEIQPGTYVTDHDIPDDAPEYFKLTVKAGQRLIVKATNPTAGAHDILSSTVLYDKDRVVLISDLGMLYGAGESETLWWLPSSKKSSYTYYLTVGGGDIAATTKGTRYEISIENNFDAGSQTDAGDTFETAMEIKPGAYEGYVSGDWGTDTKDLYKLYVEKGTALTVKVTPPSDNAMGFMIYNSDREMIAEEHPPNPGAIVKTTQEIKDSGSIYIAIVREKGYGKYTLEITTKAGAAKEAEEGTSSSGGEKTSVSTEEESAKEAGKGISMGIIYLIIGVIAIFIIGIVVYFLLKKKKP